VQAALPPVPAMKRKIQRARTANDVPLSNPTNLSELSIPDRFKTTDAGQPFLLFDSKDSQPTESRILIFSTYLNLDMMVNCNHWYADGTFKTTPPLFAQVWTIHGLKYNNVLPTVFALLPNKTQATYIRTLEAIKILRSNLNPQTIMLDFEQAEINAFKQAFPSITVRGCFFHLSQSLWRRIQCDEELASHYTDVNDENDDDTDDDDDHDDEWPLNIRKLLALAFVPVDDVVNAFEELMKTNFYRNNEEILDGITSYFESNWIGKRLRSGNRREPKHPIPLWNQYDATLEGLPKTNNSIEGWHRAFSSLLNVHHPNIWKFIEALRKEQGLNETKIEQYVAGRQPTISRKSYRDTAQNIEAVVKDYANRSIDNYLRGIAHNFKLQADM
jgi:hypothetical protein